MSLHLQVAIPTFVGSALSCIATTSLGVLYVFFPPQKNVRQALILNLLIADWINAVNNTISGAWALAHRNSTEVFGDGAACKANGYIGQFSVQAIDFNILIISIVVLVTVRKKSLQMESTWRNMIGVCALAWLPSVITSNIALGLDAYGEVSGNWCWIEHQYTDLRYALTHAWRLAIFFITIGIYSYVYIYLMRVYGSSMSTVPSTLDTQNAEEQQQYEAHVMSKMEPALPAPAVGLRKSPTDASDSPLTRKSTNGIGYSKTVIISSSPAAYKPSETQPSTPRRVPHAQTILNTRRRNLKKMLVMQGYPLIYIVLWIPGIMNRLWESIAGASPLWLQALQSSTQYIGLGNTITYAWNEQLISKVRAELGRQRAGFRAV